MVSPVIPHIGFFEAVVDTHCVRDEWACYTWNQMKMTYIPGTSGSLCISTRTGRGDGRMDGGDKGDRSTRVVSTLDNAMPCHRAGYFTHKTYMPVNKIRCERIATTQNETYILKEKKQLSWSSFWIGLMCRREFHSAICGSKYSMTLFFRLDILCVTSTVDLQRHYF